MDETAILNLVTVIVALIITYAMQEALSRAIRKIAERAGAKPTVLYNIKQVMRIIWLCLIVTYITYFLGLTSMYTTLTISGIIGLAISLSLQSTLTNVISGIILFYDRAVKIGDELQMGAIRGRVVHISLRSIWLKNPDGGIIMISNSTLLDGPMINFTAKERYEHLKDGTIQKSEKPPQQTLQP